ncbi:unnamed protein product [Dovyalis caffra]|uniref:Uncharacterized protein n=1 Tax=Dovyalis caffra TaxID=77055 RepID=A0AAV1RWN7_9ROSI|nr:unnamed protein product [Dovyalis caffra]
MNANNFTNKDFNNLRGREMGFECDEVGHKIHRNGIPYFARNGQRLEESSGALLKGLMVRHTAHLATKARTNCQSLGQ